MRQSKSLLVTLCMVCTLALSVRQPVAAQDEQKPDLATVLFNDIKTLREQGHYDDAIVLAKVLLQIVEHRFGKDHPKVADMLNDLAALYVAKGDYRGSLPPYERMLKIREVALGPDHLDVAKALNWLGAVNELMGDYELAESREQRALDIRQKLLGSDHPLVAESLNRLAAVDIALGYYERAESRLQRAREIHEKALGTQHHDYAGTLNNLALLFETTGRYTRAEALFRQALEIDEKTLGAEAPELAIAVGNLGTLYMHTGDFARAELFLRRAVDLDEKARGPKHPDLATSLNNLAELYRVKGDDDRALPLYVRVLEIDEEVFGANHPTVALVLDNLAGTYTHKGDYERAEPRYQRALKIREQALGAEHPAVATSLNNLAVMYQDKGDYTLALPLLIRALEITKKAFGADSRHFAIPLNNMAQLYRIAGDYRRAEEIYLRALEILEKQMGPEHPETATELENLAVLYEFEGDAGRALTYLKRSSEIEERNMALVLATGSQQEKESYLDTVSSQTSVAVSIHTNALPRSDEAARLALNLILQRKGRALDAMADPISALRSRANPDDQKLVERWQNTLSYLATLQVSDAGKLTPEARRAEISRLTAEIDRLEDDISRRSAEFRAITLPVTLDAVRQAVPPGTALVELFVYYPFNAQGLTQFGNPRYVAYVLRREDTVPRWAELGDAAEIDALVKQLRAALRDPRRSDFKAPAQALDARVMRPVRQLLGSTHQILLSPDGALNLIPFAALIDERGRYLIENYSLTYLSSGRDLLRLQGRGEGGESLVVFADPQYDLTKQQGIVRPKANPPAEPGAASQLFEDLAIVTYKPLPGTAEEAASLSKLFPITTTFLRGQATESALKKVNRPPLLHIATHGFFKTDESPTPATDKTRTAGLGKQRSSLPPASDSGENPLLRVGLVLAGVNQRESGPGEDGLLTALEASGLNLWGTKLVVLSACETGLGDVKNGAGVYGLRRALVLAGSETQIMSLWKVSDEGTRDLMVAYYTLLKTGSGRTEALRQVQLAMLQGRSLLSLDSASNEPQRQRNTGDGSGAASAQDYRHPYYWAAFIPSGNWRSLAAQ